MAALDGQFVLRILAIASSISAAAFGFLGLVTESKTEGGKLSPAGRFAVGGILLSCILSIGTGALKAKLDDEADARKEIAENKREAAELSRFSDEVARLQLINSAMTAQVNMTAKSLSSLHALSASERIHADAVLSRVWTEAHAVGYEGITLVIASECAARPNLPPLLGDKSLATVFVSAQAPPKNMKNGTFGNNQVLVSPDVSLVSVDLRVRDVVSDSDISQISIFQPFYGDLQKYRNILNWNGSYIEISIVSGGKVSEGILQSYFSKPLNSTEINLKDTFPDGLATDVASADILPCSPQAILLAGNAKVAEIAGVAARVNAPGQPYDGHLMLKFPVSRVESSSLPKIGDP